MKTDAWTPTIADYSSLDAEKCNFIFEQSHKKLQETVETNAYLDKKALECLKLLVTISAALLAFFLKKDSFSSIQIIEALPLAIAMLGFLISSGALVISLLTGELHTTGNIPKHLMTQDYIDQEHGWMLFGEAWGYQERIDHNCRINAQKARYVNLALAIATCSPFIAFLTTDSLWPMWQTLGQFILKAVASIF